MGGRERCEGEVSGAENGRVRVLLKSTSFTSLARLISRCWLRGVIPSEEGML